MNNVRLFLRKASIFLLIILLILTSVDVIADIETTKPEVEIPKNEQITNNKNDDSIKNSNYLLRHIKVLRGWAEGNATSGKLIGFRAKIVKINFNYLKIESIRFFPIRWEMSDFWNATAIIFNFNQTIPQGPFEMERDWIVAIIFN
jgi:hypothetical protein